MKRILITLSICLFYSPALAVDWSTVSQCCKWSGTAPTGCLSVQRAGVNNKPYITLPDGRNISTASMLYSEGYYPVTDVAPDLTGYSYPIKDGITWSFAANEITKEWDIREKNDAELAEYMPDIGYRVLKMLIAETSLTASQIGAYFTPEQIVGYQARARLEE